MSPFRMYIEMKKLYVNKIIGGNDQSSQEVNSLIVSHNGRIRCFLDFLESGKGKIRLKNCAIIKLTLTPKNENQVSVIANIFYEGEISEKSTKQSYTYYKKNDEICNSVKDKNTLGIGKDDNKIYNFYILRHGEGVHNTVSTLNKLVNKNVLDASLTNNGYTQAENAAKQLEGITFQYYFVSDLKRTHQTLQTVRKVRNDKIELKAIVLPCNHELNYEEKINGNCDGKNAQLFSQLTAENISSHKIGENTDLNWQHYYKFYGDQKNSNGTRTNPHLNRKHCSGTNMIKEATKIINS